MKPGATFRPSMPKFYLLAAALLLLLLSFVSTTYFRNTPAANLEQKNLQYYLQKQERNFNRLLRDTPLLRRLVQQTETLDELKKLENLSYGIYLYAESLYDQDLIFWNNHRVLPNAKILSGKEGVSYLRLSNGYYVVHKKNLQLKGMTNRLQAYALIPVFYQHDNRSRYLINHFVHDPNAHKKIALSLKETPFPVKSISGATLFHINRKAFTPAPANDAITFYLRLASLVLLLLFVHLLAEGVVRTRGALRGVGLLVVGLILARVLVAFVPSFINFRQSGMFDPEIYGSTWLNPSLGDLLLNVIVFCWILVFTWYHTGAISRVPAFLQGKRIYIAGVGALFLLILATFEIANVVRSLVADSKISFQVTDFFSLDIHTVVGFVVLALLSLGYYYLSRLLFRFIFPAFENRFYLIYFVIALMGLIFLTLRSGNAIVRFHVPVLVWLVAYTFMVSQQQALINHFKVTLAGVLFWIFLFSASLSVIVLKENQEKQWINMERAADRLDQKTDPSQEHTLSIAFTYLDNRFFRDNYYRFLEPVANRFLRDSITSSNFFASYQSAYSTQLFAFDSLQQGLYNDDGETFDELEEIYTTRRKETDIPNLYYYEPTFDQVIYITKREVKDSSRVVGSFFIVSKPNRFTSETFLPELFRNVDRNEIEYSPSYSYAVYEKNKLRSVSSKYPFKTSLNYADIPEGKSELRQNGPFNEFWYKASSNKIVVITRKQDTWLESITLFSYTFCAFLFMVTLLQLFAFLVRVAYGWKLTHAFSELSIRSQVHGTIIFISLLSFLIIGAATISFFVQRYNRNNIEKISRTSDIMMREMQRRLKDMGSLETLLQNYDTAGTTKLQQLVDEISEIHYLDVNVYDMQGDLRFTSIDNVYRKGVLSTKMQPRAFYHLDRKRQVQYVQEERMTNLEYLSLYTAVREPGTGDVHAYLNIPYFASQIDLQQEISNFLVTIINLNAFIFLIAGVIALFITNRITRSFSVIGNKMKAITLGQTNEVIEWNRKDEIGELVTQYNKMVQQLEASARALAKSEREGAWREMAKQVAHEIKNPLTPMKLSIQYLQKAINEGHPNVQQLTSRVAGTLVEQIDHLSKIAADFSRFANIGNQQLERFDLHDVLESLTDLYKSNPKVRLHWQPVPGPVWLYADRTHINRLFTNLLSNAVEACDGSEVCTIQLSEARTEEKILVRVQDNGQGIAPEMQQKIFVPNFTTKTSGTGLGLAMCKGIVEQAHGNIWFETEQDMGTIFFVELPVADSL